MHDEGASATFLFTDIEGSTRLWEEEPERMKPALERHDALARAAVTGNRGEVVKMTGDGLHAVFADPVDATAAILQLQLALKDFAASFGIGLAVRCGLHCGPYYRRDSDFFGTAVNRAARIMSAAHGGQTLVSQAVAERIRGCLAADVSLRDLGALRLRDLGSPERIFQLVHPLLRADFPALRSLEKTPTNLPQELTSFVNRVVECARLSSLLENHRLVTVTGMGGLGKTRLAFKVAGAALERFRDGIWHVELAAIRDPFGVAVAVAAAMGVKEEAGRPVAEALTRFVAGREMLIVLDNCEHLIAPCTELSRQLLEAGAGLRILATSREPLKVAGEVIFPLTPLAVPNLRAPFEPMVLEGNDSARLFLDRVRASRPDFEWTPRSATAVAAICHRLEGIPLALELAAARVRSLPVEQVAERLTDRFKLLKGGDPTALPRQQTLRALIDWSYDLLTPGEQSMLRQLSVFAGGCSLEAAEAVCRCDGGEEAMDLLGRLVDKCLVEMSDDSGRYRMLETVRQYAAERMQESADHAPLERHLHYYAALAERAKAGMMGFDQSAWLVRIDDERENIVAAHSYASASESSHVEGLKLVSSLKLYWVNRGLLDLGHRLILEALARPGTATRDFARCKALFDLGQLRYVMGRYSEARLALQEGLEIAVELNDDRAASKLLQPIGQALLGEGNLAIAQDHLERAYDAARSGGDPRGLAAAATLLGQLRRMQGRHEEASQLFDEAVAIAREQGDEESVAIGQVNRAMVAITQSDAAKAADLLEQALATASGLDARRLAFSALEVVAALQARGGDWKGAALLFAAAGRHSRDAGIRREPTDDHFVAPWMTKARRPGASDAIRDEGQMLSLGEALSLARSFVTSRR